MEWFILLQILLLGIGLSSLYAVIYGNMYISHGATLEPLVILFASAASFLSLMSGINQAKSIFIGKDYDTLSALPLKKTVIIASKVINLYLVELLYTSIIMVPSGVVFTILSSNTIYLFVSLIMAIFISAFPLVIALIFSFLTALISDRFKYGNFVSIALYILFMVGIFVLSYTTSARPDGDVTIVLTSISGVAQWINPALYFANLAMLDNFFYIFIFVGINVVSIIIVVLVIGLFFDKIHELVSSFKTNFKYERKYLKSKKELKSLLELEFKRLVNSKMYFMNSVVGLIMALIMGVWMSIMFSSINPFGISEEILANVKKYAFFGVMLIVFSVGITNTCAVGISMEGNNFWLVKSLPINYKKYMWAKLLLSYILQIPVALIVSTVMVVLLLPSAISIVAIYVIPVLYILLSSILSLLLNLTFYKLKWQNEQEVVKSSSSVIISMLLGFALDLVLGAVLIGLGYFMDLVAIIISIVALAIATVVFYLILSNSFERKLMNIEDF